MLKALKLRKSESAIARLIIAVTVSIFCLIAASPVGAKIYVWKDADNRTHYCNDPDDVPAEHKENVRTIESQASSSEHGERTTVQPTQAASPTASQAPAAPQASAANNMNAANTEELNELMNNYRSMRQEMREFRKGGGSLDSAEYNDLKNRLIELKRNINDARRKTVRRSQQ